MHGETLANLSSDALWLATHLAGLPILAAMCAGLLVAFIQSATQMQEPSLAFLARVTAGTGVLLANASTSVAKCQHFLREVLTLVQQLAS